MNIEQQRGIEARRKIVQIVRLREKHGDVRPPTVREIAKAIDMSIANTHRHVGILLASDVLVRGPKGAGVMLGPETRP